MSTLTFPDVEGSVRTFLRTDAGVLAALGGARVFFGIPDTPTWPLVVVARIGGGDDASEAPLDQAVLQVDCWGRLYNDTDATKSSHGDKAGCRTIANAVRSAFASLTHQPATAAGCFLYGATVTTDLWRPDLDDDRPRYLLAVNVTARTA